MTAKVFITGGTGFIGRGAAAPLKARGYDVHIATLSVAERSLVEGMGATAHDLDLFDDAATQRLMKELAPSHLLHFAWDARPGLYWTSLDNFRWVDASLNLLRAFSAAGGRRIVFAGSCAEYDWAQAGVCREVNTPLAGTNGSAVTPYAACKIALNQMLVAFTAVQGLSAAWGRIFFLYGPHERAERLVPSIIRSLLAGEPALCSHGRQLRNFLHVSDVADAFATLLDSDVQGAVNIGSDERVIIATLAEKIGAMLGFPELIKLGSRVTPPGEPDILVPDIGRLYNEVGWRPKHSLTDGLAQTINWWRAANGD